MAVFLLSKAAFMRLFACARAVFSRHTTFYYLDSFFGEVRSDYNKEGFTIGYKILTLP
jgi:hypothetical protein